jgi:8-hydroxy-5-deazaflavin:NADPH oxidoreductase
MKIGILGTGMVGQVLASAIIAKGHEVMIGTRDVAKSLASSQPNAMGMPAFGTWHKDNQKVQVGTFAETAAFGELLLLATNGSGTLPALELAGANNLGSKTIIDISNPLDFSNGMPPSLFVVNTDSLAEQIQRAYPNAKIVKSLNTMTAFVMLNPNHAAGGDHTVFLSGNDEAAKAQVRSFLEGFGWKDILDLGDIKTARGVEMILPLWLSTWGKLGNTPFQFKIAR